MDVIAVSFGRTARRMQFRLAALAAAIIACTVFLNAATFGTSSYLHVNLSFMPFTYYDTSHLAANYGFTQTVNGTTISSCPSGASVRSCFQTVLGQLAAQGVTGIRIFVTFCDASSLAFVQTNGITECGLPYTQVSWNPSGNSIQQTWINNVGSFFADVKAAGIANVHITTGASSGDTFSLPIGSTSSPQGSCSVSGKCCSDTGSTVYFNPLVPFGMASNGFPISNYYNTATNQGYNCAPTNSQYFVGWTNYLNVINAILAKAYGQVTVFGLEIQQEVQTQIFHCVIALLL